MEGSLVQITATDNDHYYCQRVELCHGTFELQEEKVKCDLSSLVGWLLASLQEPKKENVNTSEKIFRKKFNIFVL